MFNSQAYGELLCVLTGRDIKVRYQHYQQTVLTWAIITPQENPR